MGGKLKEYAGAVFFIDILGVGALTQGKINITENDFKAHNFKYYNSDSEHQFCAKLLLKFRRILISSTVGVKNIKVAQLSDCAFIWSDNPSLVVNVARDVMWKCILGGVLCRGGIANGQIVEPDKINRKLGMFICGGAVTEAVKLESAGKGARIFIKPELVSELESIPHYAFVPRKSLIDFSILDEFEWYRFPDSINSKSGVYNAKRNRVQIVKLVAMLRFSPKFTWNSASLLGEIQVASSIDIISSSIKDLDLKFEYETILGRLNERSEDKHKKMVSKYMEICKNN